MQPTRRGFLLTSAAALSLGGAFLGGASLSVRAAETDNRFVLVFLRGAMDGLNVVVPYGDANLKLWRPSLVLPEPGAEKGLADLGGFWGLHPSLKAMHALYAANDLLPIQCVAGPNRSRSHFEAQDMMEIGAETRMTSGWLNRIAALLPVNPHCDMAFTMGSMPPLILHGPTPTTTWDPFHTRPRVSAGFYDNIVAMHAQDARTGADVADGLRERRHIDAILAGTTYDGLSPGFPRLARAAARMLAAPDGPRLAELELDGWDTHTGQPPRLAEALGKLDEGIAVLRAGLAEVWTKTAILVVTEFGRTVRVNGSGGTDHGTGTAAILMGGAVAGGRVLADWPGLGARQLFEDRDLQPTLDIRAVTKGLLGPLLGLSAAGLTKVFPDSESVTPRSGLLKV
ncbi:DUF1501 domain-containing protein [Rhodopila sp.]|uniref:DUF1501 domain-containing protein n=1 Tax=Rhodopila sp. TaxID=2480087 RepID=UPI003D1170AF